MVREKIVIHITVSTILEIDDVESMEKILGEDKIEFSSLQDTLLLVSTLIAKAIGETFRFLS
jgi:hypothetical protein